MNELIIGVMLLSTHLGDMNYGAERTLATPGVYLVAPSGLTAGMYRNTLRRTSVQLGYTYELSNRWAISGGLVSGYPATKRGYASDPTSRLPTVYAAVSYRFGGERLGARVLWVPLQRTQPVTLAVEGAFLPK